MRAFKNNISIILITFLIPIISYSQKHQQVKPDGHIIEKQFNVNTYHGLNMGGMGKVYLTDGKVGEIKIKGDENMGILSSRGVSTPSPLSYVPVYPHKQFLLDK